jgi:transcriptional regulator with XRE-family HTH domain
LIGQVVGRAIRTLRASRGWSQTQLAAALNELGLPWKQSQVTEAETGHRQDLTLSEAILLAEVLNVRLADLVSHADAVRLGGKGGPEQAVATVIRVLAGGHPLDAGLIGPHYRLGLSPEVHGEGPWWLQTVGRVSTIYSALEVKVALRLGIEVQDVHDVSQELWGHILDHEVAARARQSSAREAEEDVVNELATSRPLIRRLLERHPPEARLCAAGGWWSR